MSTVGRTGPFVHPWDWTPCIVTRNTVQSIPNNSFTTVSWVGEVWDAPNWHSNSTNPGQIKPENFTGTLPFLVVLQVKFATNGTGKRRARIYKNATEIVAESGISGADVSSGPINLSMLLQMVSGDFVTAEVFQDSGGALDLDPLSTFAVHAVT
jgi:hypothetical protein